MPETILLKELMWEYNCPKSKAQKTIDIYKKKNKYDKLSYLSCSPYTSYDPFGYNCYNGFGRSGCGCGCGC